MSFFARGNSLFELSLGACVPEPIRSFHVCVSGRCSSPMLALVLVHVGRSRGRVHCFKVV